MPFASTSSSFSVSTNYSTNYRNYLNDVSSQFEKLSKGVSSSNSKDVTEDVYESMIKDVKALTSAEPPHRHTLVKKATGILKLSQFQHHKENARAVTAPQPDLEGFDFDDFFFELENRATSHGSEFRTHLGKNQKDIIAKLASNGGNFSQIWDEFEAATSSENSTRPNKIPRSSVPSKSSVAAGSSQFAGFSATTKPRWKYFTNSNILSSSSVTSIASSVGSKSSNLSSTLSSVKRNAKKTSSVPKQPKSEYMKQVFVVKGQVITFKANEFGKFTNWFGDDDLLKECRHCSGEFQRELDMSGFKDSEIRIKLHEGYKLVVEAYRPVRNGLSPLRHKSTILLPEDVPVDKLVMCRTSSGRLIIIHLAKFPATENNTQKKKKK